MNFPSQRWESGQDPPGQALLVAEAHRSSWGQRRSYEYALTEQARPARVTPFYPHRRNVSSEIPPFLIQLTTRTRDGFDLFIFGMKCQIFGNKLRTLVHKVRDSVRVGEMPGDRYGDFSVDFMPLYFNILNVLSSAKTDKTRQPFFPFRVSSKPQNPQSPAASLQGLRSPA